MVPEVAFYCQGRKDLRACPHAKQGCTQLSLMPHTYHFTSHHVISRVCHKRHISAQLLEAIIHSVIFVSLLMLWWRLRDYKQYCRTNEMGHKDGLRDFKIFCFVFLIKQFSFLAQPLIHVILSVYKLHWSLVYLTLIGALLKYGRIWTSPSYYIWVCTCMLSSQMV